MSGYSDPAIQIFQHYAPPTTLRADQSINSDLGIIEKEHTRTAWSDTVASDPTNSSHVASETNHTDSQETNTQSRSWASAASLKQASDDYDLESDEEDSDSESESDEEVLVYFSTRFCNTPFLITGPYYRAMKDMESEGWKCNHCQKGAGRAASWSIAASFDHVVCAYWGADNYGNLGVYEIGWLQFCDECIQSAKHGIYCDEQSVNFHAVYSLSNFDVHKLPDYNVESVDDLQGRDSLGDIWHCPSQIESLVEVD